MSNFLIIRLIASPVYVVDRCPPQPRRRKIFGVLSTVSAALRLQLDMLRKGVLLERTYIHSRRLPLGLPAARDPMSRETPISLAPPSPTHAPWPA